MSDTYSNSLKLQPFQLKLTFFDDKFAAIKYEDELRLSELADVIATTTRRSKAQLPWLKLATFTNTPNKNNCLRYDKNVVEVTGVEVDYDGGETSFDEAVRRLRDAGLCTIVYTSASYVKGEKEKWRVLAPFSQPRPPNCRAGMVGILNGVLGGGIDPTSFNLSTAYYYGSVNDNPAHRVELLEGQFLDLKPKLAAGAIGRPARVKPGEATTPAGEAPGYSDEDIGALLQKSQIPGHWHNSMVSVTSARVLQGRSNAAIFDETASFADGGWGDEDIAALVASARAKWGVMDPDDREGLYAAVGAIVAEAAVAAGEELVEEPNWRERYKGGTPKPSMQNAILAIGAAGIVCSEDVFHNKMWIGTERQVSFRGEVTDAAIHSLRKWLSDRHGFDLGEVCVRDAVLALAHENQFNPVVDMLADAEASWDGVERLDRAAVDYFNVEDTELHRQYIRKTLIAAVRRARQPGCKFDTMPVLESKEGWNKSSIWSVLAGEGNFSDERIIGHGAKEVQEQLAGIWIHENADLAGLRKAEVETVKAFASRQVDRARPAYGRFLKEQPRHSIEVGTTNATTYLPSQTGNRRFWPLKVEREIDLDKVRAVRLKLWGEAARWESAGESIVLDRHLWAEAEAGQEARRVVHPWEPLLEGMVEVPTDGPLGAYGARGPMVLMRVGDEHRVRSKDIFEHVLPLTAAVMNMGHAKTLSELMQRLGWVRKKIWVEGTAVAGYVRPVSVKVKR